MQVFATRKATAGGIAIAPQLTPKYRQAVRIMKLSVILLFAFCMQLSARGLTQTVTINVKEAPLQTVIEVIEKQTGYVFFYSMELLKQARKVTLKVNNLPLQQVLDEVFREQPLGYVIAGKNITISVKEVKKILEGDNSLDVPPIDVRGRVVDENGEPVQASISVRGSTKGTTTNQNGEFQIFNVYEDAVLVISGIGIEEKELKLNGLTQIVISVKIAARALDELQVIAYGTTTKRLNTGNVTSIKSTDIEKQPVNNPLLALQARIPGLFITQQSGLTGGGVTVRVQGQNSIASGNEPLIVIDGVPYYSEIPTNALELTLNPSGNPRTNPSPLTYINTSDIESISVLKDADATAIYGSRAANGAILITTKKGKPGKTRVDLNLQHGWGQIASKVDMLNARQYLDMRYEAYKNDGVASIPSTAYDLKLWDTTHYTDWQKELIGKTAHLENINLSISGGSINTQYLLGFTYQRQSTVFPGNFSDNRGTLHFNLLNSSENKRFKVEFSANYMFDKNTLPGRDLTQLANLLEPVAPKLHNDDGTLNWASNSSGTSTWDNPYAQVLYEKYANNANNLFSNATFSYKLFTGFEIKSSFGFSRTETNDYLPTPLAAIRPEGRITNNPNGTPRIARYGNKKLQNWIIEPQILYSKDIGRGRLEGLVGVTIQQNELSTLYTVGRGYNSEQVMKDIKSAANVEIGSSLSSEYRYNAIFGRLNYNLLNKYIVNLTGRRDGSSRFGSENQFNNFGSVGVAWIFGNENFFESARKLISFGKLRASYGSTGNDQVGDFKFINLYNPTVNISAPYQGITSIQPGGLTNKYLQWETTRKLQIGFDLGILKDRVVINTTFARNRSSNQLVSTAMPETTGFSNIQENFPAVVQNISWEIVATSRNITNKSFDWSTSVNLTVPQNKVIKFPNIENTTYASGEIGVIIGQPLGVVKVFHFLGVDPISGEYLVADRNGHATSSPDYLTDRTVLINKLPTFYGGFQNNFRYKGLYFDFLFQFVKQLGTPAVFNNTTTIGPGVFFSGASNQPLIVLQRWQKEGDDALVRKFSANRTASRNAMAIAKESDRNYSDASFIRLKNVSLSWNFPSRFINKVNLSNFRVYITGQNLITITNFEGMDPENQSLVALPPLKMITIGLQVTF